MTVPSTATTGYARNKRRVGGFLLCIAWCRKTDDTQMIRAGKKSKLMSNGKVTIIPDTAEQLCCGLTVTVLILTGSLALIDEMKTQKYPIIHRILLRFVRSVNR